MGSRGRDVPGPAPPLRCRAACCSVSRYRGSVSVAVTGARRRRETRRSGSEPAPSEPAGGGALRLRTDRGQRGAGRVLRGGFLFLAVQGDATPGLSALVTVTWMLVALCDTWLL